MARLTRVTLRPMVRRDFALVSRWLEEPHVRRWWVDGDTAVDAVAARYGPRIDGSEPTEMFVICAETGGDAEPIGLIQRYRIVDYPDWARTLSATTEATDATASAGIDYLVGEPDAVGRGLGTQAIRLFVPTVYDRWDVTAVLVGVQQANTASWRALERAGFVRIWAGSLDSDDPSDAGPAFVYRHARPA